MRKSVWMSQLERALSREGMTGAEKRTVMNYYEEMYQDKLDDGMREEDIIREFGFPEDVAQNVRENEDTSVKCGLDNGGREEAPYRQSEAPIGRPVDRGYDVESQGYSHVQPDYNQTNQRPPNPAPPQNSQQNVSILRVIAYILIAIILFSAAVGLSVAGVAVIGAAFATISFSVGVWLIVFGVGLILFACGCLLFAAAIKFVKSSFPDGGAR